MATYKLVREARSGRQSIEECVHYLDTSKKTTACEKYGVDEISSVRTLGSIRSDVPVCEECSKHL